MAADGIGQRFQQSGRFTHPVGKGRAFKIDPFTLEYLALAIQRKVVGVFADQHMRQQTGSRTAALDRTGRQVGLADLLAA